MASSSAAFVRDARDEHGVVRRPAGVEAADKLLLFFVEEIAVRREAATSLAINDADWGEPAETFLHQFCRALGDGAQIAGNQITARQRRAFESHQARAVRVREDNEDGFLRLAAGLRDVRDKLLVFHGAEHAMIEREKNLPRLRRRGMRVRCLEHRHRGAQRSMHAGRALVLRRAPHAVVDANGRSDVSPGEREATAALGRVYFSDGRLGHDCDSGSPGTGLVQRLFLPV